MFGFTKIMELIAKNKEIPIIGHNCLLDYVFIYEKFIDILPDDYYTFKHKLKDYLPIIYDTKLLMNHFH